MQQLRIQGGQRLVGRVRASGAKNAALPILASCLLTAEEVVFENVPHLTDVRTMLKLLEGMGVKVCVEGDTVRLNAAAIHDTTAPYDLVKTMRASILVLGPLVARFGTAKVSLPGGCAIGARPVDQHIQGLRQLGAQVSIEHGYVVAQASRLQGATLFTDMVTVTGTENLVMAATLAQGTTVIENAAQEPEVVDLVRVLKKMGARIEGEGTSTITVHGVESLHGAKHRVLPDRIEVGSFLVAGAMTQGDVLVTHCVPEDLKPVLDKLQQAGAIITQGEDWIRLVMQTRPKPVNIRTAPHPGFPTDMQAQLMTLNTIADGASTVTETIFENRFMHVPELNRLGANITIEGPTALIEGVQTLTGAHIMATDLRASASLVIAALAAQGESVVSRIYHLDRGYDAMEAKLRALGANIVREQDTANI